MLMTVAGCAVAPPPAGRWQVVGVPYIKGDGSTGGGAILVDTQTGDTWLQTFAVFPDSQNVDQNVLYWAKIPRAIPTTLPTDGTYYQR